MSIYHRYALYYNLQRYLADVERLRDIVSECTIVDDSPEGDSSIISDLSAFRYIYEDPVSQPESTSYGEDGQHEGHEIADVQLGGHNKEGCTSAAANSETQLGSNITLNDLYQPSENFDTGSSENNTNNSSSSDRTIECDDTAVNNDEHPGNFSSFSILRSQLDRVIACQRILYRLNAGLVTNINRVEAGEDNLSSQTIKHFWREAGRLNGSQKIKSLRVLEREMASNGGWGGEPSKVNMDDAETAWDTASTTASTIASTNVSEASRQPSSPLCNSIIPDDLMWDDQVQQWWLDIGRPVDEQGRRYVKI